MPQEWERRAPLTGAVFAILLAACFIENDARCSWAFLLSPSPRGRRPARSGATPGGPRRSRR